MKKNQKKYCILNELTITMESSSITQCKFQLISLTNLVSLDENILRKTCDGQLSRLSDIATYIITVIRRLHNAYH